MSIFLHLLNADVMLLGVCLAAAYAASVKFEYGQLTDGQLDRFKINFASLALGFGTWAVQFIGLLGDHTIASATFMPWATMASLALSMLGSAVGLRSLTKARTLARRLTAGASLGATFLATHALGLLALRNAQIAVDPALACAGSILAVGFAALAGAVERGRGLRGQVARAALLVLAVLAAHLFSDSAVRVVPSAFAAPVDTGFSNALVSRAVALASAVVLAMSLWAVGRETRRRALEAEALHLRGLADAVLEGIVIVDGEQIVASNKSFSRMLGKSAPSLAGLFAETDLEAARAAPGTTVESQLFGDAETIPVELVVNAVHYKGADREAIAVRDLRSRRKAEDQIRFLAHNDVLTGLLNRASFGQKLGLELTRLRRGDDQIAVLYLDLDRFKQVNDVMGHAAGDAVLREVALRIQAVLGPADSFARLGGDEFAIIRTEELTPTGLDSVCNKILAAVAPPITIEDGRTAIVGASIGVATYPHDGKSGASLLAAADAALYQAKAAGRNTYRFYETKLAETLRARQQLEHDLRLALEGGQLRMVYQPQARIHDKMVDGYEALIRWDHPKLGAVSPDRFIPIAEESGLIIELGEWVLRQACTEAAAWPGGEIVSVNVSAVQLHANDLPNLVHLVLLETGLSPQRLELEITETALIKNATQALHVLRRLKALGVSIAMDDFGTGFSSLSNLRNYPIDTIKIDGSFVRGVDHDSQSATIVRAVLGLGGGLGMKVIAEGVETREEECFLVREGCGHAQGYFYGRPGDASAPRLVAHG